MTDATAAVAAQTNNVNQAKAMIEQGKTTIPAAQAKVTAKETTLKALAEAAAKVKAAADERNNFDRVAFAERPRPVLRRRHNLAVHLDRNRTAILAEGLEQL